MKVIINKRGDEYSVYIPKKDLEERVVNMAAEEKWGGIFTLSNGWQIEIPFFDAEPSLPMTVNAKRIIS